MTKTKQNFADGKKEIDLDSIILNENDLNELFLKKGDVIIRGKRKEIVYWIDHSARKMPKFKTLKRESKRISELTYVFSPVTRKAEMTGCWFYKTTNQRYTKLNNFLTQYEI